MEKRKIVVCGATGKQGGAVLDALIESGKWDLLAFSRDPNHPKAQAIKNKGVTVIQADLADKASLCTAFEGAYGVYAMTMPLNPKGKIDTEIEWEQGKNILEACKIKQVKQIVFSSVLYVEEGQEKTLTYIKRKVDIENLIKSSGMDYTFLCPGSFMDDFGSEYLAVKKNVITGMAADDAKLPWVACRDIGKFAAEAFDDPGKYNGQKINLIADFLSGNELAQIATGLSKQGVRYRHKVPPYWLMWIFARVWIPLRQHFEKWGQAPYPPSMIKAKQLTREYLPESLSFEQYLIWKGWDKKL